MNPPVWRYHSVAQFRHGQINLIGNGRVEINKRVFSISEAIEKMSIDGVIEVERLAGIEQFLLIKRPLNPPLVFRYKDRKWERWVRLYRVDRGHFQLREIVRSWGLGVPFYFLCWLVALATLVRAIYLMCQPDLSWGRAALGLLAVLVIVGWLKPQNQ